MAKFYVENIRPQLKENNMAKEKKAKVEKNVIESTLYGGKVAIRFYPDSHQYWMSVKGAPFKRKSGVTSILGIKDKSTPLSIWQQQITADYLFKLIDKKEIINEDMIVEAVMQCDIQKDEAADIGHKIHEWCEGYIKNKLKKPGYETIPEIPDFPEAINGVNSFLEWEKEHDVKFISSERIVYSMKHDYMGTLDIEAIVDGKLCLVDLKSSNGLYNAVRMQTEAYASADEEESPKKKYKGRWAIRLSKFDEREYNRKEELKNTLKMRLARIQGKTINVYPPKKYQVFEAKFLDADKTYRERDWKAFMNCLGLWRWDKETDPFINKENW